MIRSTSLATDTWIRASIPPPPPTVPSVSGVFKFIKSVFDLAEFSPECNVIALVYCNRLCATTSITLHPQNWRPIVLSAILLAQKVWDDRCLANVDFPYIWRSVVPQADASLLTLQAVNACERRFLELLQYNVTVKSSVYAKYYFELRSLCRDGTFSLAPLSREGAAHMEAADASSLAGGMAASSGGVGSTTFRTAPPQNMVGKNGPNGWNATGKNGGAGVGPTPSVSDKRVVNGRRSATDLETATTATPASRSKAILN